MAKVQTFVLAVTLLLVPALQVYGRVLPADHDIKQKDVEIPKKLTDKFPKDGNFAKHISNSHEDQTGDGKTHVDAKGTASGTNTLFQTDAQGQGKINKLTSNGKGHGTADANVNTGGFTKLGVVSAGGIIHGSTDSEDDGKGSLTGKASGSAKGNFFGLSSNANVKLDGKANGVDDGTSDTHGSGASGGKVFGTVSGLKGNVKATATDDAKSNGFVNGGTSGRDRRFGPDTSTAHGKATGDAVSKDKKSDSFGKGEAHGGSTAGKTHATIDIKGTGESEGKKSDADGEGKAFAQSSDGLVDTSKTTSKSTVNAKEDSKKGGAKATAKGIADTGVKDSTAAHSDTKATVKTGELNNGDGTKVTTRSKHVAALKPGAFGSVSAHGTIKSGTKEGKGDAVAKGGAHSTRLG